MGIIGEKGIINYNAVNDDEESCIRVEVVEGDVVVVRIPILNLKNWLVVMKRLCGSLLIT
ncbi:hypothetical protein [Anaerosinus gibii]|uniref:Uncharacterized protein n=1 Tax=Selenobaculum gibii TaxID=3054208 RepID=A0A9Y2AGV3_9FIRM|nr:hypothetical protein [Selenobaculum gbiensis]WIW71500.1 hypothetical protein P3F81_04115 [Selenobaculum gbiensis]